MCQGQPNSGTSPVVNHGSDVKTTDVVSAISILLSDNTRQNTAPAWARKTNVRNSHEVCLSEKGYFLLQNSVLFVFFVGIWTSAKADPSP